MQKQTKYVSKLKNNNNKFSQNVTINKILYRLSPIQMFRYVLQQISNKRQDNTIKNIINNKLIQKFILRIHKIMNYIHISGNSQIKSQIVQNFNQFRQKISNYIKDSNPSYAKLKICLRQGNNLYYQAQKLNNISTIKQPTYFTNDNINSNKICLCCQNQYVIKQNQTLQQFVKNSYTKCSIFHINNYDQFKGQQLLKQKICGLLNSNGGCFICQASQKYQRQVQLIRKAVQLHFPKNFKISIERVKITQQFCNQGNIISQKSNMFIRANLVPQQIYLYSVLKQINKQIKLDKFYFMQNNSLGKQFDTKILQICSDFYSILHNKFLKFLKHNRRKKYSIKNTKHHNIPFTANEKQDYLLKISQQRKQEQLYRFQQPPNFLITELQDNKISSKDQQPNPMFKNQSVILLTTNAEDRYIELMIRMLKQKKMADYLIMKPFLNYRNNAIKSIWFVSHAYPAQQMRQILDKVIQKSKKILLAFITCSKFISIRQRTFKTLKQFFKTFKTKYGIFPQGFMVDTNKKQQGLQQIYQYYIKFQSYQHAIFAFVFLDTQRIRCMFIKQKQYSKQYDNFSKKPEYINLKQFLRNQQKKQLKILL